MTVLVPPDGQSQSDRAAQACENCRAGTPRYFWQGSYAHRWSKVGQTSTSFSSVPCKADEIWKEDQRG